MNFARRIRRLRLECGLSQWEFAQKIGVPIATVEAWENAASKPNMNYIQRMSEIFDKEVDYIIYGSHGSNDYFEERHDNNINMRPVVPPTYQRKKRRSRSERVLMTASMLFAIGFVGILVFVYLAGKHPWTALYKNLSIDGVLGYVLTTQTIFPFGLCVIFLLFSVIIFIKYLIDKRRRF